jgi:hypothetical protein
MTETFERFVILGGIIEWAHTARIAADRGDDQRYHAAMHAIRELAWEGKEIIHKKRWSERIKSPLAKKRHDVALEDLLDLL